MRIGGQYDHDGKVVTIAGLQEEYTTSGGYKIVASAGYQAPTGVVSWCDASEYRPLTLRHFIDSARALYAASRPHCGSAATT